MCEWNDTELVEVTIPADLSHTSEERKAWKHIDKCIVPLVSALEKAGIAMRGSCCGHGRSDGYIALQDGRYLMILPNRREAVSRQHRRRKKLAYELIDKDSAEGIAIRTIANELIAFPRPVENP